MAKLPSKPFKVGPGEIRWAYLNGQGSLNDMGDAPRYEYKATVVLPKEKAAPFIKQLKAFWEEYAGKGAKYKSLGFKEEEDGTVSFTFKTNTSFKQKDGSEKPTVIRIFRANGQEITDSFHAAEKKAANGSEGVVHGVAAVYDRNAAARGLTLYLSAVQFTKFQEYKGAVEVEAIADVDDGLDIGDGLDVAPVEEKPEI